MKKTSDFFKVLAAVSLFFTVAAGPEAFATDEEETTEEEAGTVNTANETAEIKEADSSQTRTTVRKAGSAGKKVAKKARKAQKVEAKKARKAQKVEAKKAKKIKKAAVRKTDSVYRPAATVKATAEEETEAETEQD
ncbi:MAG: hypothetical protein LBO73_01100 [Holosporaceae bacterium]|nr:hypothetical protein [Holosporaceae bacterium]